jgi:hypothetical protein
MYKLKLTEEQIDFIDSTSDQVCPSSGKKYAYIPFWFEIKEDNTAIPHSLDKLPEDLKFFLGRSKSQNKGESIEQEAIDIFRKYPLTPDQCFHPDDRYDIKAGDNTIMPRNHPEGYTFKKAEKLIKSLNQRGEYPPYNMIKL